MSYLTVQRKRDGRELTADEIRAFFEAYAAGSVPDYQMSAFLMAVFFRGMTEDELSTLVDVMLHSGVVVDLSALPGIKVDKHSTGGVGDKVSLVLAPLVASLGVIVPMMSGRGLGHTGGTVDKLESIPGFRTALTLQEYRAQLERIGCALIAQTDEVAPLDRRLYALRDVTGTVEAIPLIASSIMSKKLAEGIDALVLDIKVGNGAFIPERARAEALARTMIGIATEMLALGGIQTDRAEGAKLADAALRDGRAFEKMREIILAQGGNASVLDDPAVLPQAPVRRSLEAPESGCVAGIDVRAIGRAAVALGAGRSVLGAEIDPAVGFHITVKPGEYVQAGERIATVFAATAEAAEAALAALAAAVRLGDPCIPLPLIGRRISHEGAVELARA